jgi:glycosyltransferase involved in cell wall biosynthesis
VKFSVLLPTRNRLELLHYAVESVRRQDYGDWEIIVSDNDSTEDVGSYVRGLQDSRIRYVRTARFVPVTDNWNNALAHSSGEYVVMLGDDDCLLPGYFATLAALIEEHAAPDLVYVEAVQFAYPNVIPGHSKGFVQTGYCEFMFGREKPFILPKGEAGSAVAKAMTLRLSYSYNMQHSLISRVAIRRLERYGPFFQSPYPDYYASNVLLLTSKSVLVVPEPLVAIGISPKSFGFYYFNAREAEGTAFLDNLGDAFVPEHIRSAILPGSALITCWFVAMAYIERNFGREYGVRTDTDRYRYLQVLYLNKRTEPKVLRELWSRLTPRERLRYGLKRTGLFLASRLLRWGAGARFAKRAWAREGLFPSFDPKKRDVEYHNILELFEHWRQGWRPA